EKTIFVQIIGLPPKGAANHLLTEKLRAEGANAEYVGDSVGVPTFGEHRYRYDATNRSTQLAIFANCIHDLAKKGDVVQLSTLLNLLRELAPALYDFTAEPLDLVRRHGAKAVIEPFA